MLKVGHSKLLRVTFEKAKYFQVFINSLCDKIARNFSLLMDFPRYNMMMLHQIIMSRNAMTSPYRPTISGVFHGSILRPVLFALYIFDFPQYIKTYFMHLYADNVRVYFTFSAGDTSPVIKIIMISEQFYSIQQIMACTRVFPKLKYYVLAAKLFHILL